MSDPADHRPARQSLKREVETAGRGKLPSLRQPPLRPQLKRDPSGGDIQSYVHWV